MSSDKETIENYAGDDPFIRQFVVYAARGRCVRECKERLLPPKLRNSDPTLINDFRKRIPYSYLHYAYYQVNMIGHVYYVSILKLSLVYQICRGQ